jgi:hypothetical protein
VVSKIVLRQYYAREHAADAFGVCVAHSQGGIGHR